jgi:hypothetical protein
MAPAEAVAVPDLKSGQTGRLTIMTQNEIKPRPNPLPSTVQDLQAMRKVFHQPTLNDRVDTIFVHLWENEQFRRLLDGVYDSDTVEGSRSADDIFAAVMIRDAAKQRGDLYVAGKNAATLSRSMRVVAKRYGIGRKERAHEVAGQIVNMSNDD